MLTKIFTSFFLTLIAIGGFFVSVDVERDTNESLIGINIQIANNTYAECLTDINGKRVCDPYMSESANQNENTKVKEMYNNIVALVNLLLGVLTIIVSPAIMLSSWLMSPDWTSGDLFGLRGIMYQLWVTMSNITYFIYAILLIFIALATIFGRENFAYKQMLPKLALGIILVPMTWWFIQFTISLATTVTTSVISIPHKTLMNLNDGQKGWWTDNVIPTKIEITGENFGKKLKQCKDPGVTCISPETFLKRSSGMYGYMMVYAYGVFKVQELEQITTLTDSIKAITQLIHQGIVGAIMFLVFGILTLGLIFMLLARAVMLWLYTIFSPFLTLELVLGGMMKKVSDDFNVKEFIGLAFIPAIIGLSLSFGLVVIAAVQTPKIGNNVNLGTVATETCDSIKIIGAGCKIGNIMGDPNNEITRKLTQDGDSFISTNTITIGGVDFIYTGKATGADDEARRTQSLISIIGGTGTFFGTIIVDIIALLFIWMAFMAAKSINKVVNKAAEPFETMGKKIGELGVSLPKYMPLPIPGVKGGMSLSTMQKTVELGADKFHTEQNQKSMEQIGSLMPGLVRGAIQPKDLAELKDVLRNMSTTSHSDFEKAGNATAKLQGKAEYTNTNYETIAQSLKEKGWTINQIAEHLKAKNITDPHEKDILTKMYTGTEQNEIDKKKAWELNKKYFNSGASTSNNSFNIYTKVGSDKVQKYGLKFSDLEIDPMKKEDLLDTLKQNINKLVTLSDDVIKKELNEIPNLEESELNDIINKVKAKRKEGTSTSDSSSGNGSGTTPP